MASNRHAALLAGLAAPGAACLFFFFLLPIGVVAVEAFADGGRGFARLAEFKGFWPGVLNTVLLGLAAGTVSLAVGFAVAYHLARLSEGLRTALMFVVALPLTFSGLIVAFGFILTFGRAGFVTLAVAPIAGIDPATFAGLVYSPYGLAFVYSYYLIPRVVMLLLPVLVNFDRNQIAAAESLGAGRYRAIADVLVPQVMPTALAAFCLVVAVAIGAYGTALALVGTQVNILPLQLFAMVSDANTDFPATAALALILTAMCTCAMAVGELFASRHEGRHSDH